MPGTAYNKSMGGVGIALRDNRFINPVNPASVTARDTLSFMADVSVYGDNKVFRSGDVKSASNTFNIGSLIMSFPIYKSSAFMIGISPVSNVGYGYSYQYTDPNLIGNTGNITYSAIGKGSTYQAYIGAGVTFWHRLSLGAQFNYYFGSTERTYAQQFTESSYNGIQNGQEINIHAPGGKFGVQYNQPIGTKASVTVGATYRMQTAMNGYIEDYKMTAGSAAVDTLHYKIDTLYSSSGKLKLASEKGVGVCFRYAEKLIVEFDYIRSNWTGSGLENIPGYHGNSSSASGASYFTTTVSEDFRLGLEYIPNRYDARYYMKRVSYRAGAYYRNEYYKMDGQDVKAMGITLGATFPVHFFQNGRSCGLTVAMDLGQRGRLENSLIRERYINFSVGMNLYDIWFIKPKYD